MLKKAAASGRRTNRPNSGGRQRPEHGLEAFALVGERYVNIDVSRVIAGLPLHEIEKRIDFDVDRRSIVDDWHQWLKDNRALHGDG